MKPLRQYSCHSGLVGCLWTLNVINLDFRKPGRNQRESVALVAPFLPGGSSCLGFPGWLQLQACGPQGLGTKHQRAGSLYSSQHFQCASFLDFFFSFPPIPAFICLLYSHQSVMICSTVRGLAQVISEPKVSNYNQRRVYTSLLIIVRRA